VTTDPETRSGTETYFTERPRARSKRRAFRFLYRGQLLSFTVDTGVFSTQGLDPGTDLLIEHLGVRPNDRALEIGCGWGAVGVALARAAPGVAVVLTEVNRRAARLAEENLAQNGATNAQVRVGDLFAPVGDERFDLIVSNPPFRAGRDLVLRLLAEAPAHLAPGGRLLLVGKGSQGILYYQRWLEEHWDGPVTVLGRRSGYRVLQAVAPGPAPPPAPAESEALKNRAFLGNPSRRRRPVRPVPPASTDVRTRESGTGE
jgi:16S rRNA (guanine1207-N2)-methyltransferase